jgi:hypothetical protein
MYLVHILTYIATGIKKEGFRGTSAGCPAVLEPAMRKH